MIHKYFRQSLAALSLLAAAAVITAVAGTEAAAVDMQARFDNDYIHTAGRGERYLEIEVMAPEGMPPRERASRPPMNIALVIDKSGSMATANKMGFVKEAARAMIDRLEYGDRFAVVAYDDHAQVLIPSEMLEDRDRARSLISRLYPGGSTNLGAGLSEGYNQVRRHYVEGGINRVLLLSDGLANRGVTSPYELSRMSLGEAGSGVSLAAFGVGLDFNEDLMASLAESGRGTYYYIDEAPRIPEILAREFSFMQRIVALNVYITIELQPEVVVHDILGYEYRREGNRYHVRLGDLAGGEKRRIMARIETPGLATGEHRVGRVKMKYSSVGSDRELSSSRELRLHAVRSEKKVSKNVNREVSERSSIFEANAARQEAAKMVDLGNIEGARKVLRDSKKKIKKAPVQSKAVKEELEESDAYSSVIAAPMDDEKKSSVQKGVKYRSYQILQSK